MNVSIIIVNYNTVSLSCDAIDSVIEKTENIDYEIIVIDNNSPDNSEEIIPQKYGDKVMYVKLNENIGFGRANNEGIKYAKGRNIFLLNPDTILINNAVKILSDYLDTHSGTVICGGNLYDNELKPAHSYSRNFISFSYELDLLLFDGLSRIRYGKNREFNHTKNELSVKCIVGADLMVKKLVIKKVGGFDPDFFMYHEEQELCHRIIKNGYEIKNIPQAKIIHLEGKSFSSNIDRLKKQLDARNLFYKKTHNIVYHTICNGIFYVAAVSRLLLFKILNNREKFQFWSFILKNIK